MTPIETHPPRGTAHASVTLPERRGRLALLLEEVLTVICRLRVDKPVGSDPEVFRERVKKWLSKAAREAAEAGYAGDTITMAGYAVIAFLDESVLNSPQPMFSEWPRRPLQEEIFGEFLGGEAFFENLEYLLNQPDSEELGDLIEVHLLCLSLGFQGRYAAGARGELDGFKTRGRDKVVRIRGAWGDLSPSWRPPPPVEASTGMDRVTRWVAGSAAAVSLFFGLLWLIFFVILRLDKVSF
ncbi:MAG: DotU family type IV/VI secretion system protein [Gemmatimonadetes bacterium]|nr:type IVB secretion system protein IcmH/DotU [Gemmatimonadota bacterium]NNM05482.1 DotU family type IV/VI secretion system protein [Gemmatimonadota bacterium]